MPNTSYSSPNLMEPEFSRKILEKFSNIRVHENVSCGSRGIPRGLMDRQTDKQIWRSAWK